MKILRLSDPSHGWIDISFGIAPDDFTLTVSDVPNDCLRDLAAATVRLLSGSTHESAELPLEPDFATCQLHRLAELVQIQIFLPRQSFASFDSTYPLAAFSGHLRFELLRIQARYFADGDWTQSFPDREVSALRA